MSFITAIVDHFFAKDLWIEITPEMFTFRLETSQLSLKTVIWIQKSRDAVVAVGEELSRAEIQQNGMTDDIQRVDLCLLSRIRALIVLNTLRPFSVSLLSKFKTEIYLTDRRSTLPDSRGFALK